LTQGSMTTDYTDVDLPACGYRDREMEILPPEPLLVSP
jgi:hypothetical protein